MPKVIERTTEEKAIRKAVKLVGISAKNLADSSRDYLSNGEQGTADLMRYVRFWTPELNKALVSLEESLKTVKTEK